MAMPCLARSALANDNATLMFPYPSFPAAGENVAEGTAGSVLTKVMLVPSRSPATNDWAFAGEPAKVL